MKKGPFITLDDISVRLWDTRFLRNISWQISGDEHWAVLGPNGAGKSTLVRAIFHDVPVVRGKITYHFFEEDDISLSDHLKSIGYVSSELHREIMERETLQETFRDFSGKVDEITTVEELLLNQRFDERNQNVKRVLSAVAQQTGIEDVMGRSITTISMGEMRKALIARALMRCPRLLILDEPFDGLDDMSRHSLAGIINALMAGSMRVVLITHRFDEILPNITHVLFLKDGRLHTFGKKDEVFNQDVIEEVYGVRNSPAKTLLRFMNQATPRFKPDVPSEAGGEKITTGRTLIEMKKVTVKYADVVALYQFDWRVLSGENWVVLGPNGAGKSTVLKLITGDNLQAYSNDVRLFGKQKGSGESIWDIKRNIGFISSEMQVQYPGNFTAFEIVCSGLFDSVGLFRFCSAEQRTLAQAWIETFGIGDLSEKAFGKLSFGQRQLVLIARAMVKSPILLMLDEPCEGLDIANREKVLEAADYIGGKTDTNLIFVTHREEEILPCMTNKLELKKGRVKNVEVLKRSTRG